jgi:hypothetical protein
MYPETINVIATEEDRRLVLKEDETTDWTESFKYAEKWPTEAQAVASLADMDDPYNAVIYKMERIIPSTVELDYLRKQRKI